MAQLRVLHEFTDPALVDEIVAAADRLRDTPGCASAEVYRTLADEDHWALTEIWDSEDDYARHWDRIVAGEEPALREIAVRGSTEFYARAPYALVGARWVPEGEDETARRIFWPARGALRIIIQNAYEPEPTMREATRAEIDETRREPGCLAYAWMENVEVPNHLMLLEVWSDQLIYDRHWEGRLRSVELRGDSGRRATAPSRGPVSREFYRQQRFQAQYGAWQPAEVGEWAASVSWSAT